MKVSEASVVGVQELSVLDAESGDRIVIANREFTEDMSNVVINERDHFETYAHGRCDISSSGRIAFAPDRDRWLVVVRNYDGTGICLNRRWSSVDRSDERKEAVHKMLGGTDDCIALDTEPAIGRVRWRPSGELWVEPFGVEPDEGAIACFDEFSRDGRLLRRVQLVAPESVAGDKLVLMEDGRFVLLRGFGEAADDEADAPLVAEAVLLELASDE